VTSQLNGTANGHAVPRWDGWQPLPIPQPEPAEGEYAGVKIDDPWNPGTTSEQQRSERWWKWGARGIYAVGLIIAAPVQFMHFWDPKRPSSSPPPPSWKASRWSSRSAPPGPSPTAGTSPRTGSASCSARDRRRHQPVRRPHRPGDRLQRRPHRRHRLPRRADRPDGLRARHRAEGRRHPVVAGAACAEKKAAAERSRAGEGARREAGRRREGRRREGAREPAAEEEQQRKDADRKAKHPDVWEVADALRSARGSVVTEQIWAEAWYLVTGCKTVGIRPEIEAQSRPRRPT
jgi:hypothetical protein